MSSSLQLAHAELLSSEAHAELLSSEVHMEMPSTTLQPTSTADTSHDVSVQLRQGEGGNHIDIANVIGLGHDDVDGSGGSRGPEFALSLIMEAVTSFSDTPNAPLAVGVGDITSHSSASVDNAAASESAEWSVEAVCKALQV